MSDFAALSFHGRRTKPSSVTELQGGSGAAFDWLVTHYSGPVYGLLVAGMIAESSDAADITQDVFLKGLSRHSRISARRSSLKTWLYRIAIREAAEPPALAVAASPGAGFDRHFELHERPRNARN